MANSMKTENLYEKLKEYNEQVYICTCENKRTDGLFEEYKITQLMKEKNYTKAAWVLSQTDYRYTLDDEDYTYEINQLLDVLRCSNMVNKQLNKLQEHKEKQIRAFIATLEDYSPERELGTADTVEDERDAFGIFLDAYYYYSTYVPNTDNLAEGREIFIQRVLTLLKAKDNVSFSYPLRINDKELLKDLKKCITHKERVQVLQKRVTDKFSENPNADLQDLLLIGGPSHTNITSFLTKYDGVRQSIWKYEKNTLSWEQNKYFLMLLALYIGFPLTDDYEHFLNYHGHTLNSPLLTMKNKNGIDIIWDWQIKSWLNSGITINCILEMFKKRTAD